jgi:hypothetical protein
MIHPDSRANLNASQGSRATLLRDTLEQFHNFAATWQSGLSTNLHRGQSRRRIRKLAGFVKRASLRESN